MTEILRNTELPDKREQYKYGLHIKIAFKARPYETIHVELKRVSEVAVFF